MSFKCFVCGDEFKDMPALARHKKKYHPKEKEEVKESGMMSCPVCHLPSPWSQIGIRQTLTVCSRCLCIYDLTSGDVIEPPPEFCFAEEHGQPCPLPAHKYYNREFKK